MAHERCTNNGRPATGGDGRSVVELGGQVEGTLEEPGRERVLPELAVERPEAPQRPQQQCPPLPGLEK